jgi:hypothetical protein
MANVSHASLTGSNLHEPKGVASATAGTVYIADGAGSGAWSSSTSIATGMIADFVTPLPPTGWLELDGSAISTTTFSTLYTAMTIQQAGARGSGSAIITGLSSTTHMRAGYYVFGTGIASGTKILTVDSSTQITMDANASSSGTATVIVSPWLVAATTITLPDVSTAARFRRSRSATVHMGVAQADIVKDHTHSGTTSSNGSHSHVISISDPNHSHGISPTAQQASGSTFSSGGVGGASQVGASATAAASTGITAGSDTVAAHSHTITTGNQSVTGGTETRPISLVVMTCVKT